MIENGGATLVWMLPLLGVAIWLQRSASFMLPAKHLAHPLIKSLNRWAPMAVITLLVLVSLDTGLVPGWRGIAIEVTILAVLAAFYWLSRQVLVTVLAAALIHWGFAYWLPNLAIG